MMELEGTEQDRELLNELMDSLMKRYPWKAKIALDANLGCVETRELSGTGTVTVTFGKQ